MKNILFGILIVFILIGPIQVQADHTGLITSDKKMLNRKDEPIEVIQFNSLKMESSKFGKQKLIKLLQMLESTINPQNSEDNMQLIDNYHTLILIYNNHEKIKYKFFQQDNRWYVQDADGAIYCNAEFILDFFDIQDYSSSPNEAPYHSALALDSSISKDVINWGKLFDIYDLNYYFGCCMFRYKENGLSTEMALNTTKANLESGLKIYKYAVNNGYAPEDELLEKEIEDQQNEIKNAANIEEIEKILNENNLLLEDELQKMSSYFKSKSIINELYITEYNKFRNGEDTVKDTVCWTFEEYWNALLTEIVFPDIELTDGQLIENQLIQAPKFYEEYAANTN